MKVVLIDIISFQLGRKAPQTFGLLTDTNHLVIMLLMRVSTNGSRNCESNYEVLLKCFPHLSSIIQIQSNFPSKLKSGVQANLCDWTFKNRCPFYLSVKSPKNSLVRFHRIAVETQPFPPPKLMKITCNRRSIIEALSLNTKIQRASK